jgi:hypothetical protein
MIETLRRAYFLSQISFRTIRPFRLAIWDEITITVDNIPLNNERIGIQGADSPGVLFLYIDTDFLAAGTHLADLTATL